MGESKGLQPAPRYEDRFELRESVSPRWLWTLVAFGSALIVASVLLDLVWKVHNIIPTLLLELGVGATLFVVLFIAQRRIVRETSLMFVSALEQQARHFGDDPQRLQRHIQGPATAVLNFVEAVLTRRDYAEAFEYADYNWRLCRAQAWLWNNREGTEIAGLDLAEEAKALVGTEAHMHPLWDAFAETELNQFHEVWSNMRERQHGVGSASRPVEDGEIVMMVDIDDFPDGALATEPTEVRAVPFLVRKIRDEWLVANIVGDHLPIPGLPPDWREGWLYIEEVRARFAGTDG